MLGNLGRALLQRGDYEQAVPVLHEDLRLSRQIGNKWYILLCLESLAGVAASNANWERSAQLFGALDALTKASNIPLPQYDLNANERFLTIVRAGIDQAAFEEAWNAGLNMDLHDALELALDSAE